MEMTGPVSGADRSRPERVSGVVLAAERREMRQTSRDLPGDHKQHDSGLGLILVAARQWSCLGLGETLFQHNEMRSTRPGRMERLPRGTLSATFSHWGASLSDPAGYLEHFSVHNHIMKPRGPDFRHPLSCIILVSSATIATCYHDRHALV